MTEPAITVELPRHLVPDLLHTEIANLRYQVEAQRGTIWHLRSNINDAQIVEGDCVHLDGSNPADCKCCSARRLLRDLRFLP